MCNTWCYHFVKLCKGNWPQDASILEVGSRNVNGSPRDVLRDHKGEYVGVDIETGPGVDLLVGVDALYDTFGDDKFDVVISTEMLEHVEDWRLALHQMSLVLKPGGWLLVTTRSPGFEYHPYPLDCWRFTLEHFCKIFVPPMRYLALSTDPDLRNDNYSGVGVLAKRTDGSLYDWCEHLCNIEVNKP